MSLKRTSPTSRSNRSSSLGKALFLLAAVALAVASCGRLPVYSHYEHISSDSWRRDDTISFTAIVADSADYHLTLGLRATNAYPYTQLKVNANILTPHTSHLSPHTSHLTPLTIDITNAEGEMQGRGNNIRHYTVPIGDITLSRNDTLTVSIHHAMSRFSLPGIIDVGLTVER